MRITAERVTDERPWEKGLFPDKIVINDGDPNVYVPEIDPRMVLGIDSITKLGFVDTVGGINMNIGVGDKPSLNLRGGHIYRISGSNDR